RAIGGLFSVALSVRLPCPAVSQHLALWSPDLPRQGHALPRPPGRLTISPPFLPIGPRRRRNWRREHLLVVALTPCGSGSPRVRRSGTAGAAARTRYAVTVRVPCISWGWMRQM